MDRQPAAPTRLRRTGAALLTALTLAGGAVAATCTTTVTVTATTTATGGTDGAAGVCPPASVPVRAVAARPVHE
ncbi:hypothetical protein ACSNOH_07790 [Streptomyces sp. URMC 127]|uniref:hypothetical protein n=1 Tax=Streptomyces sp. URMC 127 TaxID=3423402 RepID=UPI003F199310